MSTIKLTILPQGLTAITKELITYKNQIAEEIAIRAKELVPVRTGVLRDSITVKNGDLKSLIIAEADYSIYVELGTRHQEAKPYMVPAVYDVARKNNLNKSPSI